MDKRRLWYNFTHSGKVEDYLRYRGIAVTQRATDSIQEEGSGYGERPKTTSDDRRPDSAQL
ncbi:MAG: hypothetical protein IKL13_05960 [Clostridia bacterium]|nr:hypothetical protein [Clostridia bacterium]